ncbi:zinc ABC transporter permease AztB [Microbacterium murale]|uniref:Zinc/manganese transport system permease protein n=1 Tax=Microbacterium murale TaxID=1081040 RepID=A0ABU0P7C6_9MICO|nr:zinc ABC transporter permease AztB [Microbacterium murale]MDQ0642852.1 zinc/manganese transport system permease protein [Microbacterium murale]
MSLLLDPFTVVFVQRALLTGALVAVICGVVGTWVVLRGMAFLGEAMAHGMLPGIAVATLLGIPPILGAAISATGMSLGIGMLQRRGRLSADTSIGLLFVASLALGVIVISASRSFATDATAILFGDILAAASTDVLTLAIVAVITLVVAFLGHRSFVAITVDPRQAQLLGLRPQLAHVLLVGLITLAVVAAYQAVGSLLVVGMLLGPAVAAGRWATRIPSTMALAALIGTASVAVGLLISWHAGTAAGATIAFVAIASAAASAALHGLLAQISGRRRALVERTS